MSNSTEIPDAVIGTAEPSSSRVILVLLSVVTVGMFGLFSTVFGWDNIPVVGDIVPLMSNLGGSESGTTCLDSSSVLGRLCPHLQARS